jgi:hypothetical protein
MWLRRPEVVQALNEGHNISVAFYGQVVDQNSNGVPNATVDLHVQEEHIQPFPEPPTGTNMFLQRQTGADGRFEVSGLIGHSVIIDGYAKEGYEPDFIKNCYGEYAAQSGSFTEPILFRLWSTNFHQALISGDKSFHVVPDGRHYAIDLLKGTIAEGDEGDLVAWFKRPEPVTWGQSYDWSCELAVRAGGLSESESWPMSIAPEAGYTNVFACQGNANAHRQGVGFGGKRFYVKLHDGQMFGRIVISLRSRYLGDKPAEIGLSYAVNPSGSRLLW